MVRSIVIVVVLGFATAACTHLPEIGGMPLPKLTSEQKSSFRNLADIPEPPATTAPDVNDASVEALSQERSVTEHAAEELRAEPFIQPTQPPPVMPF